MTTLTSIQQMRVGAILALAAGMAIALPAVAKGGHPGKRDPAGWIAKHAEELGIDDATLAQIDAIVEASRAEGEAIYAEHRAAREAMHELLDQDAPELDAVMRQAEVIGAIDVRKHQHRLATMLEIRSRLTPEQRTQLRALKDEMRERHGDRHHRHPHEGDPGCGRHRGDGPPPEEAL